MNFGRRLLERRLATGLTQARLAEIAGVSRALVSAVEGGRHLPRVDAALALASALGTTADALFGRPGAPAVDALSGEAPAPGAPVRVSFVGEQTVSATVFPADSGLKIVDGLAGELDAGSLGDGRPSAVVAGCEPGLVLLERMLRERGVRALAIGASSAGALAALRAGRLHAAAVHYREGEPPPDDDLAAARFRLARWRVGLAAPHGSKRAWWRSALSGRDQVIQREPGASVQAAFERALDGRRREVAGPRANGHFAAVRHSLASGLPAVTIEPAAAAAGADFHALETHDVELWVAVSRLAEPGVERLVELIGSATYHRSLSSVGAYELSGVGSRVA